MSKSEFIFQLWNVIKEKQCVSILPHKMQGVTYDIIKLFCKCWYRFRTSSSNFVLFVACRTFHRSIKFRGLVFFIWIFFANVLPTDAFDVFWNQSCLNCKNIGTKYVNVRGNLRKDRSNYILLIKWKTRNGHVLLFVFVFFCASTF